MGTFKSMSPRAKFWLIVALSVPELVAVAGLLWVRSDPWYGARRFEVHGVVEGLGPTPRMVLLRHDDIPGLMPGMTMPFEVADESEFRRLHPGDSLRAVYQVSRTRSRLAHVAVVGRGSIQRPPTGAAGSDSLPAGFLVDSQGRPFSPARFRGQAIALAFFYTRCPIPEACPRLAATLFESQEKLRGLPELKGKVRFLTISLDPRYDTPARLAEYARGHGVDSTVWTVATGDTADVRGFAAEQRVLVRGSGPDMTHQNSLFIYRPDGELSERIEGTAWTADDLIRSLRKAIAAAR
jgi:protein SCO1/2